MDLTLNESQLLIVASVDRLVERNGGYKRSMTLLEDGAYDEALHQALREAGFFDIACGGETGPLEAGLVIERLCAGGALVSAAATALVYPMVTGAVAPGPVALASSKPGAPFRFGQFASTVLIDGGDEALSLDVTPADTEPADNDRAGWPLARLKDGALGRAKGLGAGSGDRLRNWWRVGLALETAGTMRGAIDTTNRYVKERVQFNRPIGSFQAVQHRLGHLAVHGEASYWLALRAAYHDADRVEALTAASYAATHAPLVFRECHQFHGAMGFTREYHLHVWTMRLAALQRELGGALAHSRELARRHLERNASRVSQAAV